MSCNIVQEYVSFSENAIHNSIKLIMSTQYDRRIYRQLIKEYINYRYYHLYEDVKATLRANVNYYLEIKSQQLIEETPKKEEVINNTLQIIKYLVSFDYGSKVTDESILDKIEEYRMDKLDIIDSFSIKEQMSESLMEIHQRKEQFLSKFACKEFQLIKQETSIQDLYNISLSFDIKFPKLYSDYAIQKTFNSGIIAEERLFIEYYLISLEILNNMIDGNYKGHYLVDFISDLCEKKKKLKRLFYIIDSDVVKDKINLKIVYSEFCQHRETIYELMRQGYQFVLFLDKELEPEDEQKLSLFRYCVESGAQLSTAFDGIVVLND